MNYARNGAHSPVLLMREDDGQSRRLPPSFWSACCTMLDAARTGAITLEVIGGQVTRVSLEYSVKVGDELRASK
jgi:hypothetical protein